MLGAQQQKDEEIRNAASSTLDKVSKAKEIIRLSYQNTKVEYESPPNYFTFLPGQSESMFYAVYNIPSHPDQPWFLDIYALHEQNASRVLHENFYSHPHVFLIKGGNENLFVWYFSEGSGAYLSFAVLRYDGNKIEHIESSHNFDGSEMGGAVIKLVSDSLILKTKSKLYKLIKSDGDYKFTLFAPKLSPDPKKHLHILKCTTKGNKLIVLYDNEPIAFYKSDTSTTSKTVYRSLRKIHIIQEDRIVFDNISGDQPPPDADFGIFAGGFEFKDYMGGMFTSLVPKKTGECSIGIRFKWDNWFEILYETD
jgi:hypothetical protein